MTTTVGKFGLAALALGALGAAGFYVLTAPATWRALNGAPPPALAETAPDLANGQTMFWAGGCASCHAVPGQDDRTRLAGGLELPTPFGTFRAPNISPDTSDGIGSWTTAQFVTAMREGVSPDGRHYYPAFPYTSYQRMRDKDLTDLFGFIKTLPAAKGRVPDHTLAFPYTVRRGLGVWKLVYLDGKQFQPDTTQSAVWNRGAYLVNGPGHCAECHSTRDALGGIMPQKRLAGGPDPEGKGGFIPNLTSHTNALGGWAEGDIAELLTTGFTPDFDSVGGSMASVVKNTAKLSPDDRKAMAHYLKTLPPVENGAGRKK